MLAKGAGRGEDGPVGGEIGRENNALYLIKPLLFSHRTNGFWEALLAPVLLAFQWLGIILPERGPWRRYVYQPGHLKVAA